MPEQPPINVEYVKEIVDKVVSYKVYGCKNYWEDKKKKEDARRREIEKQFQLIQSQHDNISKACDMLRDTAKDKGRKDKMREIDLLEYKQKGNLIIEVDKLLNELLDE